MRGLSFSPAALSLRKREAVAGYLFIGPALLGFILFIAGPLLVSLALSFTEYRLMRPPRWIGLDNYRQMFADELVVQAFKVTMLYALAALPLQLTLSLGLALLLNMKLKGIAFWRTIFYLPAVISGVAIAVLWSWILNPEFGLLNSALRFVGIHGPNWLGDTRTALPSLVMISLWTIGGSTLIYLAGLQGIPTELYEAAEIDGANSASTLFRITLPLLSPVIFFNLVIGLIGVFQFFTEPFIMTQGGPEHSTLTFMLHLYRNGFNYFKMGYASALAWVLFLFVLALTLLVFRSTPFWVHYDAQRENTR
jgi:multiple sugar transport system permease protein